MKKIIISATSAVLSLFIVVMPSFAHVVVKPNETGAAVRQVFTVGVPNEKDNPTTGLRLLIPDGLKSVTPNVKPGWTIDLKKSGEGVVTEIEWTGGSIPMGQRDEFYFQAQAPASETTLIWKAYQTYQDGTVISWDQNPDSMKNISSEKQEENEKKGLGPYSQTKILNDLAKENNTLSSPSSDTDKKVSQAMVFSFASLALSVVALVTVMKRK